MKNVLKQAFSLMLVILISIIKVNAQETTSEIQGTVTSGATGLAGVSVTAIHQPTGTKYSTTTRTDGRYNLINLKVGGPYLVEVSYVGFKKDQQNDINLLLGQAFRANFKLVEASNTLQEVVVRSTSKDKVFST
jgi:hypothetical protein